MIRVRFAPSPTGYLHIGNVRTALFNWLFARHLGGRFILRIEDTDLERSEVKFIDQILNDLRWLGLDWDEGPDIGGEYGPYIQSQRQNLYTQYIDKLIEEGKAYYCYCSSEELQTRRDEALKQGLAPRYDNRCRSLTNSQIKEYKDKGIKPVVRFKIRPVEICINDIIRGDVKIDTSLFGDIIIQRSDGSVSFHFAVCLDDMLMKITHVVRGEDHLTNTAKHILLFEALGVEPPKYAHLPMILGKSGQMLSKREGSTSVIEYRNKGVLPEAFVNYMCLLGWAPKNGEDILDIKEVIKEFDIKDVGSSPAIFDQDKLNWVSAQYIKKAQLSQITQMAIGYLKNAKLIEGSIDEEKYNWLEKVVDAVRDRLNCISEISEHATVFLKEIEFKDPEVIEILNRPSSQTVLSAFVKQLEGTSVFDDKVFNKICSSLQKELGIKGKDFYMPIRIAITGLIHGPELTKVVPILGNQVCIYRIKKAII